MEGLIPLVVNALKKNRLHQHSFKSLSDSSRRSYHHLLGGGDSFNGSSHRRNHSEFQAPSSMDLVEECGQPEFADPRAANLRNQTRSHSHTNDHLRKEAHQKWL